MTCIVSVPERSKGVDSSSTVFALVGSNPTADIPTPLLRVFLLCIDDFALIHASPRSFRSRFSPLLSFSHSPTLLFIIRAHSTTHAVQHTTRLLHARDCLIPVLGNMSQTTVQDCSKQYIEPIEACKVTQRRFFANQIKTPTRIPSHECRSSPSHSESRVSLECRKTTALTSIRYDNRDCGSRDCGSRDCGIRIVAAKTVAARAEVAETVHMVMY